MQCSQWKIFKNLSTNISDEEGKKLIIRVKMYEHLELFSDNEQRFSARGDIFIYSTVLIMLVTGKCSGPIRNVKLKISNWS